MKIARKSLALISLLAALAGCHDDKPHDYGHRRPPVGELDAGDRGIQSKDLLEATDQMTMDLLALPELNDSRAQWTIVATGMENDTTNRRKSYDIFLNRLKTQLTRQSRGRITLIENRDRYRYLQNRELEPTGDPKTTAPGPAGVQPQFALAGTVEDLPNRRTNTFRFEFRLSDLRNRTVPWVNEYIVKVER
jgi:hypothetical protein